MRLPALPPHTITLEPRVGDVIEFESFRTGNRITAEVMLTAYGKLLLDLMDGERPVIARFEDLLHAEVFEPDPDWGDRLDNPPGHLSFV